MRSKKNGLPVWARANAWREICARIFEGTKVEYNALPEWLVNPTTGRRLKLDMLYPTIGVAVRLEGLQGKSRRQRPSLQEEEQEQIRMQARADICRAHGVELIMVDVGDNPKTVLRVIDLALSRARQRTKDLEVSQEISQARTTAVKLARRIKSDPDLNLYADLWQDRQYQIPESGTTDTPRQGTHSISYTAGMEVEHTIFGPGIILAVTPSGDDLLLSVDFVTAGQKTLAASLVGDKLMPRQGQHNVQSNDY